MMQFVVEYKATNFNGEPQYLKDECSFIYTPWNNVDFSIMIGEGYNSLDLNLDDGYILQLTGFNRNYNWIKKELVLPKFKSGLLKVLFKNNYSPGTGIQYTTDWHTYFDKKTGWICVGYPDCQSGWESVEFAKNTIAVVTDGQLKSVWINPRFI